MTRSEHIRALLEEYSQQRRDLFSLVEPAGVIQEGENMVFLATQAELYIGQNFLLAARGEGDTPGAELSFHRKYSEGGQ